MKNALNFLIFNSRNTDNIHTIKQEKIFYEQYNLVDLDIFSFLHTFCIRNYIQCDQKPYEFRLIISINIYEFLKFSLKKLKKYCKLSPFFNTK